MSSQGSRANPRFQMASFPPEILCEIFLACIPAIGNTEGLPAYFPYGITHVCRHWYTTALGFRKLWSFLDVEQTDENQFGDCLEFYVMEEYLERSGEHPLTFRMAYSYDTMHYQTYLECLGDYSERWQSVVLENPNYLALEYLSKFGPSEYPLLRSLVCINCRFNQDAIGHGRLLDPIPWSQLERYQEHDVSWSNSARQWEVIAQLTNVVDLRASFFGPNENNTPIKMPHLRFASLAVGPLAGSPDLLLDRFDFSRIEGLNLKLPENLPAALSPVPNQLKGLKILRLCGSLDAISNGALVDILTEIKGLPDFAVELAGVDAVHLFSALTPTDRVLVPQLRVLRVARCTPLADGELDALLEMLRQRFGKGNGPGVDYARLKWFEFLLEALPLRYDPILDDVVPPPDVPSTMFDTLEALRTSEGWDIRANRDPRANKNGNGDDFWADEMDDELLYRTATASRA
ncbi:hypothetical protein DFH08DRAFT_510810 [Mycena albidolilacea]|uniref:F-box domain-containing protein n=1 Tax=Mycena albidolilacea TaxID=1033008 RepID=A0AAD7AEK4_9AGAR|nr:hypothetical protein DFH08DRAFT_510810 [Mycena albidolilacea]